MASQTFDDTTSITTLLSTGLNSLGSGSRAVSSAWSNSDLDLLADFELYLTGLTAPADGDELGQLWLIPSADGTNDPTASSTSQDPPAKYYVGSFFAVGTATTQRDVIAGVPIFPRRMTVVLKNTDGTAYGSSGNTLRANAYCLQTT